MMPWCGYQAQGVRFVCLGTWFWSMKLEHRNHHLVHSTTETAYCEI